MRFRKHILQRLLVLLIGASLGSCGIIDFDFDENIDHKSVMHLDHDEVYVMVGDQFSLTPVFEVDSLSNTAVYFVSLDNEVVTMTDNVATAVGEGETYITALSVMSNSLDSCLVHVMPVWQVTPSNYAYETLVYADIDVNGKPYDPKTMVVAAFMNNECRAVGEPMETAGVKYTRFRVYGTTPSGYGNGSDEIQFRVYLREKLDYEFFQQRLDFDGETHGSLTNLFKLSL